MKYGCRHHSPCETCPFPDCVAHKKNVAKVPRVEVEETNKEGYCEEWQLAQIKFEVRMYLKSHGTWRGRL